VNKHEVHVSDSDMEALATTAALGNFAVEDLVGAAAWAFAGQDEDFKEYYIRTICFQGSAAPPRPLPRRRSLREKLHGLARRLVSVFG
jgi:hypothetical protein